MMNLTLESANYTETDFPHFNPDGYLRVRAAVELAQMKRTIGMSLDDMREASRALEVAMERKNAEQRIAIERFDRDRQTCFDALCAATQRIGRVRCNTLRRCQLEGVRDHLVTLYGLKDFDAVRRELPRLDAEIRDADAQAPTTRLGSSVAPAGGSASSHFYRGQALERRSRLREAVEAYNAALAIDARHVQAKVALARLVRSAAAQVGAR